MRMGNLVAGARRGHAASLAVALPLSRVHIYALVTKPSVGHSTSLSRNRGGAIGPAIYATFCRSSSSSRSHCCSFGSSELGSKRMVGSKWEISGRSSPRRLRNTAVQLRFGAPVVQEHSSAEADPIAQATLRWIRSTVVGLNLCPWAAGALASGNMRVLVYPPPDLSELDSTTRGQSKFPPVTCDQSNLDALAPDQSELDVRFRAHEYGGVEINGVGAHGSLEGLVTAAAEQAKVLAALSEDRSATAGKNATTLIAARPPLASDFEEFLAAAEAVDDFIDAAGLRGTVQLATFHPKYRFEGSDEDDATNYTNRSPYPILHLLLEQQVTAAVSQIGNPERVWKKNIETMHGLGADAMRRTVEACMKPPKDPEYQGKTQT